MIRRSGSPAFSLVELLLVVLIVSIILGFLVPTADQALRGSTLAQSGQMVGDLISSARQAAVARNQPVVVRFYKMPGVPPNTEEAFCAVQIMAQNEDGTFKPISKLNRLHENVMISDSATYSTLIADSRDMGSDTVSGQNASYVGFRFLPDGSTDLDPTKSGGWFVTLMNRGPSGADDGFPKNFYTIRVNPYTGQTRVFRP